MLAASCRIAPPSEAGWTAADGSPLTADAGCDLDFHPQYLCHPRPVVNRYIATTTPSPETMVRAGRLWDRGGDGCGHQVASKCRGHPVPGRPLASSKAPPGPPGRV